MYPGITVCMASIPPRMVLRGRALASVNAQTKQPAAVSVAIDTERLGAPATRQRALDAVQTEWVAFLDDDDFFKPNHLEACFKHAEDTGADFVYSWFDVLGGVDPFPPGHFLNPFNPEDPIETTITTLVRTELAKEVGFKALDRGHNANTGEDRYFTLECLAKGAKISHLVEKTWVWAHHGKNTSGSPNKW